MKQILKDNIYVGVLLFLQFAYILNAILNRLFVITFENNANLGIIVSLSTNIVEFFAFIGIIFVAYLFATKLLNRKSLPYIAVSLFAIEIIKVLNIYVSTGFNTEALNRIYNYSTFLTNTSLTRSYLIVFLLSSAFFSIAKFYLKGRAVINLDINKRLIYMVLISSLILLSRQNIVFLADAIQISWFRDIQNIGMGGLIRAIIYLFGIFSITNIISYFIVDSIKDLKERKSSFALAVSSSTLLAILFNFFVQYVIFVEGHTQRFRGLVFQALVIGLIFLLIYLITNRYLLATYINVAVSALFIMANHFKFIARHEPVTIDDLAWLSDIRSLLAFSGGVNIPLILFGFLIILISFLILRKRIFTNKIFSKRVNHLLVTSFVFGISFGFYTHLNTTIINLQVRQPRTNTTERILSSASFWRGTSVLASRDSVTLLLMYQNTSTVMFTPDNYSEQTMREIQERYKNQAALINQERNKQLTDQSVIYILSESLTNPSRLPYFELSDNPTPFIDSLVNHTGGLHISAGFGGGTANVEFQGLTGLSLNTLDNSVSVAFNSVVPNMKYFPTVSKLFDDKVVIHPVDALSYNRLAIYLQAGYREFIAQVNGTINLEDPHKFGDYVSDEYAYNLVLDNLDDNKAQFINLITMQNHSPFNMVDNPKNITFTDKQGLLDDRRSEQFLNYIALVNETDKQTEKFLDELKKVDKNITVVFYGDHLPGIYSQDIFANQPELSRLTEYFIWNNKKELPSIKENVSGSYEFIPQLLEVTDSKVTPYQALLTMIKDKLPVMQHNLFYDRLDGHVSETYDFTLQQKQLLDDYELIHYDLTLGNGYLQTDFYENVSY